MTKKLCNPQNYTINRIILYCCLAAQKAWRRPRIAFERSGNFTILAFKSLLEDPIQYSQYFYYCQMPPLTILVNLSVMNSHDRGHLD